MADADAIEVDTPEGRTVEVDPHELYVVEVAERGYWRDGVRYSEGELLEVPGHALPTILGRRPPYGHLVDDLEEATSPETEPDADPGES